MFSSCCCTTLDEKDTVVLAEIIHTHNDFICPICISKSKKKTLVSLECGHIFHKKCIIKWLLKNQNCPLCRTELR